MESDSTVKTEENVQKTANDDEAMDETLDEG